MKIGHSHHESIVIRPHRAAAITERNKSAWRPIHLSLCWTSSCTPAVSQWQGRVAPISRFDPPYLRFTPSAFLVGGRGMNRRLEPQPSVHSGSLIFWTHPSEDTERWKLSAVDEPNALTIVA